MDRKIVELQLDKGVIQLPEYLCKYFHPSITEELAFLCDVKRCYVEIYYKIERLEGSFENVLDSVELSIVTTQGHLLRARSFSIIRKLQGDCLEMHSSFVQYVSRLFPKATSALTEALNIPITDTEDLVIKRRAGDKFPRVYPVFNHHKPCKKKPFAGTVLEKGTATHAYYGDCVVYLIKNPADGFEDIHFVHTLDKEYRFFDTVAWDNLYNSALDQVNIKASACKVDMQKCLAKYGFTMQSNMPMFLCKDSAKVLALGTTLTQNP